MKVGDIIDKFYNGLTEEDKNVYLKEEIIQDCMVILEEMIPEVQDSAVASFIPLNLSISTTFS